MATKDRATKDRAFQENWEFFIRLAAPRQICDTLAKIGLYILYKDVYMETRMQLLAMPISQNCARQESVVMCDERE